MHIVIKENMMKIMNLNIDGKYFQINKANTEKIKYVQPTTNSTVTNKSAIPNSMLLKAYNNVVSFKSNSLTNLHDKYKKLYGKFNKKTTWEYFRNSICAGYSDAEVDAILNEISSRRIEDSSVCNKFLFLININNVENITYGDGIQDPITKRAKTINIPRALTPIEAKELIVNRLTKNSNIERYFNLVDDEELMPDIAINIIKYDINDKDKIRIENLSNELFKNNRKLSKDEIMTCLAFSLDKTENIQDFIDRLEKDYSGKKLDLFEAALCTVHNLDDGKTERFFELKSKQLPYKKEDGTDDIYTLSSQEAILCAKAELDEDELKRYAELKNKPFMYTAVRDHNSQKTQSTELIIAWIKDKQSNKEISILAQLGLKNKEEYQNYVDISKILVPENQEMEELLKKIIVYLSKLQDESGKNVFKNNTDNFDFKGLDITALKYIYSFQLNAEQTKDYIEILSILSNRENPNKENLANIAAGLAKVENGINTAYEEKSIVALKVMSKNKLTPKQFAIYHKMYRILSQMENPQKKNISFLASELSKLENESGKNIFENTNEKIDFKTLSIDDLYEIITQSLTVSEIEDYIQILSILKTLPNNDDEYLSFIASNLAKLKKPNGTNIFKDEYGNFNFVNYNLSSLRTMSYFKLTPSEYTDYSKITSILSNMNNPDNKNISHIATKLAKLQDESGKNVFEDKNGNISFNNLDLETLEYITLYLSTCSQIEDFIQIISTLNNQNNIGIQKEEIPYVSVVIARLQDKTGKNIFKDDSGTFNFTSDEINTIKLLGKCTVQEYKNYNLLIQLGYTSKEALKISKNDELTRRICLVDKNVFWQGSTGENKQIFDLFNSHLNTNDINGTKLKRNDFDSLPKEHTFNNGTLDFNPINPNQQGYSVTLQNISDNSTPIMIVKNNNDEKENYIVFDGAITLIRPLQTISDEQKKHLISDLSTHSHFSIEEINALGEAARHFIIDILEKNGECIIAKGINGIAKPFIGKELDTQTTKQKFVNILQKLHNDSSSPNISIENILRLMPKDSIIQIRPYTTRSNETHEILYSISAEWEDKNGKEWQLRVHSHDLKFLNNGKSWIYRLGYKDDIAPEPLFYDNNQNDFVAGSCNPVTHIKINNEPISYKNKLISNPYFQKAIREISISFNRTQLIDSIAKELCISTDNKSKDEIKKEIIKKCQQDVCYYYKYKKFIDNLLNEQGLPAFDKAA